MGANADPSGSLGGSHRHPSPAAVALQEGLAASTAAALRHDPGLAMRWLPKEQAVLDDGLAKYAFDAAIVRYAKIALGLPNKTVRDVALRCRWMAKKENNKKRKEELVKKSKEKKERVSDSSIFLMQHREDRVDLFQGIITVWYRRISVTVTGATNGRHIHGCSLHHSYKVHQFCSLQATNTGGTSQLRPATLLSRCMHTVRSSSSQYWSSAESRGFLEGKISSVFLEMLL